MASAWLLDAFRVVLTKHKPNFVDAATTDYVGTQISAWVFKSRCLLELDDDKIGGLVEGFSQSIHLLGADHGMMEKNSSRYRPINSGMRKYGCTPVHNFDSIQWT